MYQKSVRFLIVIMMVCLIISMSMLAYADAGTKTISLLTYNVAGLPDIFSSGNPEVNTVKISPKLNAYEMVAVQEDFAYHSDLISQATHAYKTAHSGNVPFGDGLNYLSRLPFGDTKRVTWRQRYGFFDSGNDELTPKGFMYSQYILEPGVYVDIYTVHTDAGSDPGSYARPTILVGIY